MSFGFILSTHFQLSFCAMASLLLLSGCAAPVHGQEGLAGRGRQSEDIEQRVRSTVREQGEVVSASQVEVRSIAAGLSTILQVVPEGTRVEAGELICELDSSALEKKIAELEIEIRSAEGKTLAAESVYEALGKRSRQLAELHRMLRKNHELEMRATAGADGEIATRISALGLDALYLQRKIELLQAQIEEGDDADPTANMSLELLKAQTELKQAQTESEYLENRMLPSLKARLELEHAQQQLEWTTQFDEISASQVAAQYDLLAAKARVEFLKKDLDRIRQQIANCKIQAPVGGTVVYPRQVGRGGNPDWYPEEGQTVRERQTMLVITDMAKLEVKTRVHETRIARINVGQQVVVRLDALPDQELRGRVTRVSQYPEPSGWMDSGAGNRYQVRVELVDPPRGVRVGMNAEVEIQTQSLDDQENSDNSPAATELPRRPAGNASPGPRMSKGFDPDEVINRVMQQHDTNGDGVLDAEEIGQVEGRLQQMLSRFDSNKDGSVDRDEMRESMRTARQQFRRGGGK